MSSPLNPEPPHLSVAVYPSGTEEGCFAALCQAAEENGCRPQGTVEVAPWDAVFELRSDLAGRTSVLEADNERHAALVSAESDRGRAVRASYVAQRIGSVVVEYIMAPAGDRHPIAVTMSAGPLGMPEELWEKPDRSQARRLVRFTTDLLRVSTERGHALYGAIDVERSLPTPRELNDGAGTLGSEIFVSHDLLDASPKLPRALATDFAGGEIADWPHGRRFFGWDIFTSDGSNVADAGDSRRFARSSAVLGQALRYRDAS